MARVPRSVAAGCCAITASTRSREAFMTLHLTATGRGWLASLPRELGELVPRQTETPALAIEHQVHEERVTAVEEADHVVLLPQREHDVLDVIIALRGVHAPQCRQNQLLRHGGGVVSNLTQHHPALGVHDGGADRAVNLPRLFQDPHGADILPCAAA